MCSEEQAIDISGALEALNKVIAAFGKALETALDEVRKIVATIVENAVTLANRKRISQPPSRVIGAHREAAGCLNPARMRWHTGSTGE